MILFFERSSRERDTKVRKAERDASDRFYDELRAAKKTSVAEGEAKATKAQRAAAKVAADAASHAFDAERSEFVITLSFPCRVTELHKFNDIMIFLISHFSGRLKQEIAESEVRLTTASAELRTQLDAKGAALAREVEAVKAVKATMLRAELLAADEVSKLIFIFLIFKSLLLYSTFVTE